MQNSIQKNRHIFCLEGNWQTDLRDRTSVQHALRFLHDISSIKYIYKNCGTKEGLIYYLDQYKKKKYDNYSICYLSFHGEPGLIKIGSEIMDIEELAAYLDNSFQDKIIHFGTCSTLSIDNSKIKKLVKKTKALCICGYTTDVLFLDGSLFDLLLFDLFQKYDDIAAVHRHLQKYYSKIMKELGFKLIFSRRNGTRKKE